MDFESLYKNYSPKVFRICLGYFNDVHIAKDITQETFITVFEHTQNLKHTDNLAGWIFKIATNKCLRQIESVKREQRFSEYLDTDDSDTAQDEIHSTKLHLAISELPELDRIIIGLYLEDVNQEKIAEIVGISYSNLRVKIHRIKDVLSKKMRDHER